MVKLIVLTLDGNSEHFAHVRRKIGLLGEKKKTICDCSRYDQMPLSNHRDCSLRVSFRVTIYIYVPWVRIEVFDKLLLKLIYLSF